MNNLTKRFFLMVLSVSFLGLSAEAWAQSILLRRYRGDVEITNSQGRNLTALQRPLRSTRQYHCYQSFRPVHFGWQ